MTTIVAWCLGFYVCKPCFSNIFVSVENILSFMLFSSIVNCFTFAVTITTCVITCVRALALVFFMYLIGFSIVIGIIVVAMGVH